MGEKELRGFEDLDCYKLALQVFRETYRIVDILPQKKNTFLLTNCAVLQQVSR